MARHTLTSVNVAHGWGKDTYVWHPECVKREAPNSLAANSRRGRHDFVLDRELVGRTFVCPTCKGKIAIGPQS